MNPNKPVVMILRQEDYDRCQYDPDGSSILQDQSIEIIPYPLQHSTQLTEWLEERSLLRPNAILIQNPFNWEDYDEVSNAREQFAVEKYHLFTECCQLLGAKRVNIKEDSIRVTGLTENFKAGGKHKGIGAELTADQSQLDRLKTSLKMDVKFKGSEPQLNEASAFIRKYHLANDDHLASLVRRRSSSNQLEEQKIELSLMSEANRNIGIAAKIKVPIYLEINTEYKRKLEEKIECSVTVCVTF